MFEQIGHSVDRLVSRMKEETSGHSEAPKLIRTSYGAVAVFGTCDSFSDRSELARRSAIFGCECQLSAVARER